MKYNLNEFEDKLNITKDQYNKLLSEINEEKYKEKLKVIPLEIKRTVNEEYIKTNPDFASNLEQLLKVFIISDSNLTYLSGMSFIAKMILNFANNDIFKAYIILKNIFEEKYLKEIYDNKYENIINKFNKIFEEKMPLLFKHFIKNKIQLNFVPYWLMTLFCFNFDEKIAKYVFNLYLQKRDFIIYFNSVISILKVLENDLLKKNEMDIFIILNSTNLNIDFDKFINNLEN